MPRLWWRSWCRCGGGVEMTKVVSGVRWWHTQFMTAVAGDVAVVMITAAVGGAMGWWWSIDEGDEVGDDEWCSDDGDVRMVAAEGDGSEGDMVVEMKMMLKG
ncbi:hypothetical protein Tco_1289872 [Tanacetum coccineum]